MINYSPFLLIFGVFSVVGFLTVVRHDPTNVVLAVFTAFLLGVAVGHLFGYGSGRKEGR